MSSNIISEEGAAKLLAYRLPPQDWRDGAHHAFLGFIIHNHTSECACGSISHWSTVMRAFGHRTLTFGSNYRRLVPFESGAPFPKDEPVAQFQLPTEYTPICQHCLTRTVGEEVVTLRLAHDEANWIAALAEDRRREQAALRAKAKPEVDAATSADLMNI